MNCSILIFLKNRINTITPNSPSFKELDYFLHVFYRMGVVGREEVLVEIERILEKKQRGGGFEDFCLMHSVSDQ
jgi:hypothetical protein